MTQPEPDIVTRMNEYLSAPGVAESWLGKEITALLVRLRKAETPGKVCKECMESSEEIIVLEDRLKAAEADAEKLTARVAELEEAVRVLARERAAYSLKKQTRRTGTKEGLRIAEAAHHAAIAATDANPTAAAAIAAAERNPDAQ